jgi:hypothetical protein
MPPIVIPQTLQHRLENWGVVWRTGSLRYDPYARGFVGAVECHHGDWYRSPQPWHEPARAKLVPDVDDAGAIESAVCALDVFHHLILKGWYVRKWHPGKVLRVANKRCSSPRCGRGAFDAALGMAHAMLTVELERPAVVRRQRAVAYVRAALGTNLTHAGLSD